jgi:uncharacterized protein YraI
MNPFRKSAYPFPAFLALMLVLSSCAMVDWLPGGNATRRATATPTVRPTFTPRATGTPWPTFTPSPTMLPIVTPGVLSGIVTNVVNLRAGPGTNYPTQARLSKGIKINVRGRDIGGEWLMLVPPPNGWVNASYISLTGDMQSLPVVEAPPTLVPTPTFAPSATAAPTATPPMYVDFRADAPYLPPGACTTIRWDVEGVRGVYLDGNGQPGHGSEQVCLNETRTYVLHIVLNSGYLDRAITVTVLIAVSPTPKA